VEKFDVPCRRIASSEYVRQYKAERAARAGVLSVESTVRETDPAWLVSVRVENDGDAALTAALRTAAPVMPPRRRGVPEAGWSDRTVTVRVPAGDCRGVGFATAQRPPDPPVEVVEQTAAAGADGVFADPDPDAVVRTLGAGAPPRDAVPVDAETAAPEESSATADPAATEPADWEWVEDATPTAPESGDESDADGGEAATDESDADGGEAADLAPPVAAWLGEVERRCDRVERVRPAAPLSVATAALAAAGGREALVAEADRLSADARRLRAVARRAEALAERAETATLPRSALEALS
jgi:hypothetical protein